MLSKLSEQRLLNVHPHLVRVVRTCADDYYSDPNGARLFVVEGLRTKERQAQLVKAGASWTMNSRHLTGHAVDLALMFGKDVRWDWPLFFGLADNMGRVAKRLRVPLRWGGAWTRLDTAIEPAQMLNTRYVAGGGKKADGPHFELPSALYPSTGTV